MHKISLFLLSIGILSAFSVFANSSSSEMENMKGDSLVWSAEAVATTGNGVHTPFWLMSKRYGVSSIYKNNAYLRGSILKKIDESKLFSWGGGVDILAAYHFQDVSFFPQQIYVEAKYRSLDAMLGLKEIGDIQTDHDLSSGGLLYSGNSRPIPQLRLGIFDYADVWRCNGWFAVKGYMAFGAFTDNHWIKEWVVPSSRYTLSTLYHSKAGFMRFGNRKRFPLEFELGMEMATEFGGVTYNWPSKGDVLKNPVRLKDWFKSVFPMAGGDDTPDAEKLNVQGNMLGAWNMALSWNPNADWYLKLYYQHFFEDHSMLTFDYPWKDGLYGLQAKLPANRWVSDIVYEFIYMKDQSGPVYWDHTPEINEQISGRDNYYNHFMYNGWQHWGYGIANPMIIAPVYNDPHTMMFKSTRMWGHHLGFKGRPWQGVDYKVMASYQRSWGTYDIPFRDPKSTFNLLLQAGYSPSSLPGWHFTAALAMDRGSLLGRNNGLQIGVSHTGLIFK